MSSLMEDKEGLYQLQKEILERSPVIVQVGLSLPGGFSLYRWEDLFTEAKRAAIAGITSLGASIDTETLLETSFGPVCLLAVQAAKAGTLKLLTVGLEEKAPRGRLWDIDVITEDGPIDRPFLNLPPRKCLVCEESAHVCRKSGAHSPDVVIAAARRIMGRG